MGNQQRQPVIPLSHHLGCIYFLVCSLIEMWKETRVLTADASPENLQTLHILSSFFTTHGLSSGKGHRDLDSIFTKKSSNHHSLLTLSAF